MISICAIIFLVKHMLEISKKIGFICLFIALAFPSGIFYKPSNNSQPKEHFTIPKQLVYVINAPVSNFVNTSPQVVNNVETECNFNLTYNRSLQGSLGFNLNQPATCFNSLRVNNLASPKISLRVFELQAIHTQQVVVLDKMQIDNPNLTNSPYEKRTEVIEISFLVFYLLNIFSFGNKLKPVNLKKVLQSQNFFTNRQLLVLRC